MNPSRPSPEATQAANELAALRIMEADPVLVDIRPAGDVIPALRELHYLHAGPPLRSWEQVTGALRNVVLGTLVHTKVVADLQEAEELANSGALTLMSANDHAAGGTFAGVIAPSSPVFVVRDRTSGKQAYAAICEGRGKCLRYGANDSATLERLSWIEGEFADILATAVRLSGGVELYPILAQALHMGDEGHSRQKAASSLFMNAIVPAMMDTGYGARELKRALEFLAKNEIFFLPLSQGAGKSALMAAEGVAGSSVVTTMAINGLEFGLKLSCMPDRWFLGPMPRMVGKYFEGYGPEDANPMIGDSEVAEATGMGAFAMAAAPALSSYVGGTVAQAAQLSQDMYRITVAEHTRFKIPALEFRGTPCAIDARKVVETGVTPIFSAGLAHKRPGIGQIGAGYVITHPDAFKAAVQAFGEL